MSIPILLSYPRSGNTFLRYCLEYATGTPTLGEGAGPHAQSVAMFGVGLEHVNHDRPNIVRKAHNITINHPAQSKMILLVRNYKECVMRHKYYQKRNLPDDINLDEYFKCVTDFHTWAGPKIIIYYEDLIGSNFATEMSKILNFLDIDENKIQTLIDNEENVRKHSIQSYNKSVGGPSSFTRGEHTKFHSNVMTNEQKTQWDTYLRNRHAKAYDLYLSRYKEN